MSNLVSLQVETPSLPVANNVAAAKMVTVVDQDTYEFAAARLQDVKAAWARLEAERKKLKEPIDAAAKAVQALFKPILDDLEAAEGVYKKSMLGYTQEQSRIAAQRQREAEEAARKQREELEAQAKAQVKAGDVDAAAATLAVAEVVQAPVVQQTFIPAKGTSTRKVWKVRVLDLVTFLKAVILNPSLLSAVTIDVGVLAKLATATDGKFEMPGCEVYQEEVLASRRAA
jgi:colicin import membrane protein